MIFILYMYSWTCYSQYICGVHNSTLEPRTICTIKFIILVVCFSTNGERACLVRLHKTTIVLYDVFYLKMLLFHGDKNGFYINSASSLKSGFFSFLVKVANSAIISQVWFVVIFVVIDDGTGSSRQ